MTDLILMWGLVLLAGAVILFAYFRLFVKPFLAGLHGLALPEPKIPRWRVALDEWEERHPRLMWTMGCSAIVFLLAMAALGALEEYVPQSGGVKQLAMSALFVALRLLSAPPWWFWLVIVAAVAWAWSHRCNGLRQEAIIELLLEIRSKLE